MCDTDGKKPVPDSGSCDKMERPPKSDPCKMPGPAKGVPEMPPGGEKSRFSMKGIIEFPWILRIIGPKHITIARLFSPTIAYYTMAGVLVTFYFCDWKAVLQYLPFWNGKYKKEFDEKAAYEAAMAKKKLTDEANTVEDATEKDPRCP